MKIVFADTFLPSLKRVINRQRWYWKLWDFFRYDMPRGIKNLIFFFPTVWKFRPWDYNYQLSLFKKSLEPLRDAIKNGHEIEITRDKKVAAITRAIEILHNITEDTYIEITEKKLGYEVDTTSFPFAEEPEEVSKKNTKLFNEARKLEEKEWDELWKIFEGQNYTQFEMFKDKASVNSDDAWYTWFNGSGMKGWWD
jgi:hypothetical protein